MDDTTPAGLAARIRRIEDRIEIADLVHEYARLLDHADHEGMAGLFAEDAVVDYGAALGGELQGRETIRGWLRGIYAFERTSHHVSNLQITFEDEEHARGICYVLAWHEWPDERPNATLYGRYEDTYRKVECERGRVWHFAERREVQHGQEEFDIAWNWIERRKAP